jgi:hypothetical protein
MLRLFKKECSAPLSWADPGGAGGAHHLPAESDIFRRVQFSMFVTLLVETPILRRHSFIAQNTNFPQKRHSFIAQSQTFSPEKALFHCTKKNHFSRKKWLFCN